MFDLVQSIKLEQLKKQYEALMNQKSPESIKEETLRIEIMNLRDQQDELGFESKKFSLLEKLFKLKEYRSYIQTQNTFNAIAKKIAQTEQEYPKALHEYQTSEFFEEKKSLEAIIEATKNAKTLHDLGVSIEEAIALLESLGLPVVLNESDMGITEHPANYTSKSSLIAVHKTPYMQGNNALKTPKEIGAQKSTSFTINDKVYYYTYDDGRDTIHMALNDEVSSHLNGDFDSHKYAYLIPCDSIPNGIIGSACLADFFITKGIELPASTWILCPETEVDMVKSQNPKLHVLAYKGDRALGYPRPFLTQLGYSPEDVDMRTWSNPTTKHQAENMLSKEGLNNFKNHCDTYNMENESLLNNINQLVGLCICLRDNHLITAESSPEEIKSIFDNLSNSISSSLILLTANFFSPSEVAIATSNLPPEALKYDHRHIDIFINRMQENGFPITPLQQYILKELATQEARNIEKIKIKLPDYATPEEKILLSTLIKEQSNNSSGILDITVKDFLQNFIRSVISYSLTHAKTITNDHQHEDDNEQTM